MHVGPSALTGNTTKNNGNLSIVIQWDAVDDSVSTYILTWGDRDVATVNEQTSYTITGLTLDTVYTITVRAVNKYCRGVPEFSTKVSFSTGITFTVST